MKADERQRAEDHGRNETMSIGDGKRRADIRPGSTVDIVLKADQPTGWLTRGVVKDILTHSSTHPHGIKVRLSDGQVGRVQRIVEPSEPR